MNSRGMTFFFQASFLLIFPILASSAFATCDTSLPPTGARDDILVIVNDNSLDSCEVGRYYAEKRNLGQSNILHVSTRPRHLLNFPEFRILMDQIIKHMQNNTLVAGAPAAPACVDDGSFYTSPYYCQASVDHLRQYTKVRYLVTTKGVPSRSRIDNSNLAYNSSTSIDNYLSFWLMRYITADRTLNFTEREKAFGDGRGMRIVDPENDGELIVGRIEGVTLDATKKLIDRIIDAEKNGIYGKHYGSKFGAYASHARWYDYDRNSYVYGTKDRDPGADSWRYQLGMFGEDRQICQDYLNFSTSSTQGKAPQECVVRFSNTPPGRASSRTPIVDDALVYLGQLHGQSSGGGQFSTVLNWVKDASCSVKLCENAADPAACRLASTDVFQEINTQCVGVADGFMGYNYQSFPVAAMTLWPTGYRGSGSGGTNAEIAFPEVRNDIGRTDSTSLWFQNKDTIANTACYNSSDFTAPPSEDCRKGYYVALYPVINITSQAIDTVNPQTYQTNFWFKADNITDAASIRVRMRAYEPTEKNWVDYGTQTIGTAALGNTDWTSVQASFQMDPGKHTQTDLIYSKLEFYISTTTYVGEIGYDDFSITEQVSSTELITNPTFADGHKEVSGGDHAAMFLNRLNGVAYWGSLSHHQSGGHSFNSNPQETLIYFLRGLPLGDAVWWGEVSNSGIFYGDPVYSPTAIRFDYLNVADYVTGNIALSGSTVNGRDPSLVSTVYEIDYCTGDDFHACDQASNWLPTGLSGVGGVENMQLGVWDTSSLQAGNYTLRLKVTSTNTTKARSQSLYDYYPIIVYNPSGDDDADGLTNIDEINIYGTDPLSADTDGDTLTDGDEISIYGTNPNSTDSDNDTMPDAWEVANNLAPTIDDSLADLDLDGLNNVDEYNRGTNPNNPDTDTDGLSDGDEVNVYLTNALAQDTDSDRLSDGDEVNVYGTDPLSNTDSDGDAMPDDWETVRGTNVALHDSLEDADSDGANNIVEYARSTLPLDAASVPPIKTIYVDISNLSGIEDGTQANPYSTVQAGIADAQTGDTVDVAAGNYILGFYGGSKNIRITGPASGGVTLSATYHYQATGLWAEYSNIVLNTTFQTLTYGAKNLVFKNTTIRSVQGMSINQNANVIFENTLFEPAGSPTAITISNSSSMSLSHVTISGFSIGIDNAAAGASITISNSILANTIDLQGVTDGSGISYSLLSDAQFTNTNNNISGDALFVDAANNDFHLQTTSPAIDSGNPADDYSNEPVNNGNRVNMGAYGNTISAAIGNDTDGDGLTDQNEICFDGICDDYDPYDAVTNPTGGDLDINLTDTDGDGQSDSAEIDAGSDPLSTNSASAVSAPLLSNLALVLLAWIMLGLGLRNILWRHV